jgi:predicted  nucleic acid-binding Zn-ribbon protein
MGTLMQNYVQTDRELAAANERLTEREISMEKEINKLREQLKKQQEQQGAVSSEPKVRRGASKF